MKIEFSDYFIKECSNEFGIRPNHVEDAITNKDSVELIKVEDSLEITLFSRKIKLLKKEFYLLIAANKVQENRLESKLIVNFAYRIPTNLVINDQVSPLELLEILGNNYGLDVSIGGVVSKLILKQRIPCQSNNPTKVFSVINPHKHAFTQNFWFRIDERNGTYIASCAICFCLDKELYKKTLI